MNLPNDLRYSKEHEWVRMEGSTATIGITEHAQSALGDVVYCELPEPGRTLKQGETFGVVESIKAVSDLFAPLTGSVTETNGAVKEDPALINQDPYGVAWMVKLEVKETGALEALMDASSYQKYVDSLK